MRAKSHSPAGPGLFWGVPGLTSRSRPRVPHNTPTGAERGSAVPGGRHGGAPDRSSNSSPSSQPLLLNIRIPLDFRDSSPKKRIPKLDKQVSFALYRERTHWTLWIVIWGLEGKGGEGAWDLWQGQLRPIPPGPSGKRITRIPDHRRRLGGHQRPGRPTAGGRRLHPHPISHPHPGASLRLRGAP